MLQAKLRIKSVKHAQQGLTLIELLAVIAIVGLLVGVVLPTYQRHVANARLHQAQAALLINANFLEKYYAQNARFTKTSTTWPKLPINETDHFDIAFTGTARGTEAGTYRLQATPKNAADESRYVIINQHQTLLVCQKRGTQTLCHAR